MYKVSDSFKGVIHTGKEQFKAGKVIPAEAAKKMDIDSLVNDGIVIKVADEKKTVKKAETAKPEKKPEVKISKVSGIGVDSK